MTIKEIVENKDTLIAQKKAELKRADGFSYFYTPQTKANKADTSNANEIRVKAVINTTNILDSHGDVHLDGIWTKSIKENKMLMHLQEHQMKFDSIISDGKDLTASVQDYTWKELGYDYEGSTQALIFDSVIKADRNPYMFKQYKNGNVRNHSVGMQYVKLELAVNDKDYKEEYAVWEKYYPVIANKEQADDQGYFWAVKEAKVIEGSAVPIGSNTATPTLNTEPSTKDTQQGIEPHDSTLDVNEFKSLIKNLLK